MPSLVTSWAVGDGCHSENLALPALRRFPKKKYQNTRGKTAFMITSGPYRGRKCQEFPKNICSLWLSSWNPELSGMEERQRLQVSCLPSNTQTWHFSQGSIFNKTQQNLFGASGVFVLLVCVGSSMLGWIHGFIVCTLQGEKQQEHGEACGKLAVLCYHFWGIQHKIHWPQAKVLKKEGRKEICHLTC